MFFHQLLRQLEFLVPQQTVEELDSVEILEILAHLSILVGHEHVLELCPLDDEHLRVLDLDDGHLSGFVL